MSPVITAHKKLDRALFVVRPFIECPAYRVTMVRKRGLWRASVRYVGGIARG